MQQAHIESKLYTDIAHHLLAVRDGCIYVGRDWRYMGSRFSGYGNRSINIVFVDTFCDVSPAEKQWDAARKLIEFGKIAPDYKTLEHRQIIYFESGRGSVQCHKNVVIPITPLLPPSLTRGNVRELRKTHMPRTRKPKRRRNA